jgi:MYXO-CTERM domain-containing protein
LLKVVAAMTTLNGNKPLRARRLSTAWIVLHTAVFVGVGCGSTDDEYSVVESEVAVSQYTTTSCSTSVVIGLSKQIADEVGCLAPGGLVKFAPTPNLRFTSNAVLPYLHGTAVTDLQKVAETRVVQVNSAFRTVAQQYLLYRWFQLGRCDIPAAARPGTSNHEGGRALDLQNYAVLINPMAARGWAHNVPGDDVHFEHLSSPDQRGRDVLAFQRLWNRNNPADKITEDGAYGPQTEARLRAAPATGFPIGATCTEKKGGVEVVMVDGPDKLAPGTKRTYGITVENTGTLAWPAATRIVVAGGATSELHDPDAWASATEVGAIGVDVEPGKQVTLQIPVLAPNVTETTPVMTELSLATSGMTFGTIVLAATITTDGDEGTPGESDDVEDGGGCSTSNGAGWLAMFAVLALLGRRRRR